MRIIVSRPNYDFSPNYELKYQHQPHQKVLEAEEATENYIRFVQGANAFIAVRNITFFVSNIFI